MTVAPCVVALVLGIVAFLSSVRTARRQRRESMAWRERLDELERRARRS